jgi:uncharacterized protein YggU (UPF0235/DUF167 family)
LSSFKIKVRVTPGAKRNFVGGAWVGPVGDARLMIKVTAIAADGEANRAVELALARALGLPKSAVSITAGGKSRLKTVEIAGAQALTLRVQALLNETERSAG